MVWVHWYLDMSLSDIRLFVSIVNAHNNTAEVDKFGKLTISGNGIVEFYNDTSNYKVLENISNRGPF